MRLHAARLASPLGAILLVVDAEGALLALEFEGGEARLARSLRLLHGVGVPNEGEAPPAVARALAAYFMGRVEAIDALAVAACGTVFQRAAWAALRAVPAGTVLSYGAMAARLGRAGAARAVGHANGANPVSLVVPCHRLVGADGGLAGYGGGVARKAWLIAHEARYG